jgi:phosphoglucosamine mutase
VMCRTQQPLSQLASLFVRFPQRLINVPVRRKPPLHELTELAQAIVEKERELGAAGRILVRYSGTENKARVMVECEDEAQCERHAGELASILQRELGV